MSDLIDEAEPVAERRPITSDDLAAILETERKGRQDAEAARRSAEAERDAARREAAQARGNAAGEIEARYSSEVAATEAHIAAREAEADAQQKVAEDALNEGKFGEALTAQRKMAALAAQVEHLKARKQWLDDNKQRLVKEAAPQPQPAGTDLTRYKPRVRQWIEQHPEYLADEKLQRRVAAQHHLSAAEGIAEGSDEYFDYINRALESGRAQDDEQDAAPPPPVARRAAPPPAMAVQRRAPASSGTGSGPVRLTPEQREMADLMYSDLPMQDERDGSGRIVQNRYAAYARAQAALKQQGRL